MFKKFLNNKYNFVVSNLFYYSLFSISILVILYLTYRIFFPIYTFEVNNLDRGFNLNNILFQKSYLLKIIFFIILSIFSYTLLRVTHQFKVILSYSLIIFFFSLYVFESYLEFGFKTLTNEEDIINRINVAKKKGLGFDNRSAIDAFGDLEIEDYLFYVPGFNKEQRNPTKKFFIKHNGLDSNNDKIFPLGNISNFEQMLTSNDSGFYPVVKNDKYGFNNSNKSYSNLDIMLIGGPFAQGSSVNQNNSIASYLNNKSFNAITVANGVNGPLLKLASLIEYAKPYKPKNILWFYYISDINELYNEKKSRILLNYLDKKDFSQNLIHRQIEIDEAIKKYAKHQYSQYGNNSAEDEQISNSDLSNSDLSKELKRDRIANFWLIKIIKLYNIRSNINFFIKKNNQQVDMNTLNDYKKILQLSKEVISKWNGNFYFVYIPDVNQNFKFNKGDIYRDQIINIVKELKIDLIDINIDVFNDDLSSDNIKFYFPLESAGHHFNKEGYRVIADNISKHIKASQGEDN